MPLWSEKKIGWRGPRQKWYEPPYPKAYEKFLAIFDEADQLEWAINGMSPEMGVWYIAILELEDDAFNEAHGYRGLLEERMKEIVDNSWARQQTVVTKLYKKGLIEHFRPKIKHRKTYPYPVGVWNSEKLKEAIARYNARGN
jgi:hypothetical protein